jgi:hypothetical protein
MLGPGVEVLTGVAGVEVHSVHAANAAFAPGWGNRR